MKFATFFLIFMMVINLNCKYKAKLHSVQKLNISEEDSLDVVYLLNSLNIQDKVKSRVQYIEGKFYEGVYFVKTPTLYEISIVELQKNFDTSLLTIHEILIDTDLIINKNIVNDTQEYLVATDINFEKLYWKKRSFDGGFATITFPKTNNSFKKIQAFDDSCKLFINENWRLINPWMREELIKRGVLDYRNLPSALLPDSLKNIN